MYMFRQLSRGFMKKPLTRKKITYSCDQRTTLRFIFNIGSFQAALQWSWLTKNGDLLTSLKASVMRVKEYKCSSSSSSSSSSVVGFVEHHMVELNKVQVYNIIYSTYSY